MRRHKILFGFVLLGILSTSVIATSTSVFSISDDVSIITENEFNHYLDDMKGSVLVIHLWTTWCGFCSKQMVYLPDIQKEYASKKVQIIGLSMDKTSKLSSVKAVAKDRALNYPVKLADEKLAGVMRYVVQEVYKTFGFPSTLIINKKGELSDILIGYSAKSEFISAIDKALKE